MPTASELLRSKVDGLTDIPDKWVSSILNIQPKIAQRLTRLMGQLVTVDGYIEQSARNIQTLTAILENIRMYMTSGEYAEIVGALNTDFIAQQATTTAYLATLGELPNTTFAASTYAARRVQLVRQLANGIDEAVISPIFDTLLTGIQTKASYPELLSSVIDNITGTPQYDGRLLAYSRQLVTDTIAVTDRAFTEIVAADLGLEWYRYLGGRIDTTRCFCDERNGKFYHKKEIELWGDRKNLGACNNGKGWDGMNRATDAQTIFAYVGGYNCQHSLLPVSVFSVPKIAIQDAIEKGYYKPDAATRKELGI
jgi:hypothetical protein